jgi:hypothetical protein
VQGTDAPSIPTHAMISYLVMTVELLWLITGGGASGIALVVALSGRKALEPCDVTRESVLRTGVLGQGKQAYHLLRADGLCERASRRQRQTGVVQDTRTRTSAIEPPSPNRMHVPSGASTYQFRLVIIATRSAK